MSNKTFKHYAEETLEKYIAVRNAQLKLQRMASGAAEAAYIDGLAKELALDAFKFAARTRDARTIYMVIATLAQGNYRYMQELEEGLFEEEKAA